MFTKIYPAARSALFFCVCLHFGTWASAQSIGDNMVTYLNTTLKTQVGGGRSFHLASEALRIAGGEFVPVDLGNDYPSTGDKVWGTLVTVISVKNNSWSDSAPGSACQPGDVIQLGSAQFSSTVYPERFTVIVASVNGSGRPNAVYRQNFGGTKIVDQATFDATTLTSGWLRIYRPISRIDRFNEWKFTVVNNSDSDQTYQMMIGIDIDSKITLTSTGTGGSYYICLITADGTVPNFLLSNQTSFFVETAKGNEIYDSSDGVGIRQLVQ